MIAATATTYVDAFERITGQTFVPDLTGATPLARIRATLAPYFFGAD
jgi:phosphoribosylaminoimidazole-succinocarboxamide synthase